MLESGEEGNIVATCSTSGFISYPMLSLYSASKFAIRGFMATLREELKTTKIQASIVSPGEVDTNIVNSVYRGEETALKNQHKVKDKDPREMLEVAADDAQGKSFPISPLEAAEAIFQGIENNDFYIFTHKGYEEHIRHIADEYIAAFDHAKYQ